MPETRYAFVTPYFKENRALLERCIASVRAQEPRADHFLIADGHPQDWIDGEGVRHIRLDRGHADFGNTPRGVGALLAICEGYDGIGLLDADCWLERDHLAACLKAASGVPNCDYVVAQRHMRRPDETILPLPDEPISEHVDTNCFFLLPGSYGVLPHFGMMPTQLALMCDRVFLAALRSARLNQAIVRHKTVNYHCLWRSPYEALGETPPEGAKPSLAVDPAYDWLQTLGPRALALASRRAGTPLDPPKPAGVRQAARPPSQVGRNDPCPCGSGLKFKRCHGKAA